jgi:hypothetical protein
MAVGRLQNTTATQVDEDLYRDRKPQMYSMGIGSVHGPDKL